MSEAVGADAVCVRFRLSQVEYQAAILRLCWGLWFYRGVASLAAIALAAGLLSALAGNVTLGLSLIVVAIVWSVLVGWMLFVRPILQYRQLPRLREEQSHCFGDDAITVSLHGAQSQVKWTFFGGVVESRDLYLVRHQKRFANIISKRAIDSRDDEMRFRQLAQRHVETDFRQRQLRRNRPG